MIGKFREETVLVFILLLGTWYINWETFSYVKAMSSKVRYLEKVISEKLVTIEKFERLTKYNEDVPIRKE